MKTGVISAVIFFCTALSSPTLAQEAMKEMKMMEAKKETIKSVSCDPACGFSVRSHDDAELVAIVKEHAKKHHSMDMKDEDVRKMMKEEMVEHMHDKKMDGDSEKK